MPAILLDDKVWFDEQIKLEQLCLDVVTMKGNGQSVLVLSHFEATKARIANLLHTRNVHFESFTSLNPSDLCSSATARVWLGAARPFRVEPQLTSYKNNSLQIIISEPHPLKSHNQELLDAANRLACNAALCFYF